MRGHLFETAFACSGSRFRSQGTGSPGAIVRDCSSASQRALVNETRALHSDKQAFFAPAERHKLR
jgi:hypothetical protein